MRATASAGTESSPKSRALVEELTESLRATADSVVPWFLSQMPRMYFQDTDHATQLSHLRAIIAAQASGRPIEMTLRSEDGSQWTSMRPSNYPGVLAELVSALPMDRPLRAAKIHTAGDGSLVLDTFEFGERSPFDPADARQAAKVRETIEYARRENLPYTAEQIEAYFQRCSGEYVHTVTPLRMCKHYEMVQAVSGSDGAVITIEREADPALSRITVAVANATTRIMLERIAARLSHAQINIHRAYLDVIDDRPHGAISLLGFVTQAKDGTPLDTTGDSWSEVERDLRRIKWYDRRSLEMAYRNEALDLERADVLLALCHLAHQPLVRQNPYAFARERIFASAERHLEQSLAVVDLLRRRFDPANPMDDGEFARAAGELDAEIEVRVGSEESRAILHAMVQAVRATYRTNIFLPERCSVTMRIDPRYLADAERPEIPYGVFFVHGRAFHGFHCRFSEIARGGLRVVRPGSLEQHAREAERLFDEVYNLSWAQHLKNKDIPEGGAKAAILVEPDAEVTRSVKAFVDGVLDLITPDPATRARVVDRLGVDELIYLGPDENITPSHIEWIVDRATRRGYALPTAFMSSKPTAGINHKEYGVTSEGVNVFLAVALRSLGIEPTERPFTVKITGGPDGDVAGNMIRILKRDYGSNAQVVGIADGSGCGEDPAGLDLDELMSLFERGLPIASFDRSKLSPQGRLVTVSEPEGAHLRNTMHNRVVADAFVTAGGRPNTIHEKNWREFLLPDGKPSSPLIVEGANLFVSPKARNLLSEAGVLIIKDSSANKCGVICSSYEIAACMLVDEETFVRIKPTYVEQVLVKLRELARREAVLLMADHRRNPNVPSPETSVRLSKVINRAAEAINTAINAAFEAQSAGKDPWWTEADVVLARELVVDHLPEILIETVGDRLWIDLPEAYRRWMIAHCLAGRIVYREGVEYLETMPTSAIPRITLDYLRQEVETHALVEAVANSNLPDRERIAALLARAGTRAALSE